MNHSKTKNSSGFTLLEVLIVVLLISIISTIATLTISFNKKTQVDNFSNKIKQLLILAEEEAMLRPATLGFAVTDDEIQFFILSTEDQSWNKIHKKPFNQRKIPNEVTTELRVDGKIKKFAGEPQVLIFANLTTTPFSLILTIEGQNFSYKIAGDKAGNISQERIDEN